ncbi:MAG TPA: restriction endonuclease subunit S, partial [Isosphaeraceae bacterium]|nr:restriction endonuclease subunit S [Isosphaeraceae bacterium]
MRLKSQETDDNSPLHLPPGWSWAKVQDVGEVKLGRQRSPEHHHGPYMRPYLRVANVFEDRIDVSDVLEMNFTPKEFETYRLKRGDILLNEGQSLELVGRPAMYRDEVPGACFQNTLVRFRAGPSVTPSFALLTFRYYLHSHRFQQLAQWTVNIAHLSVSRFAEMRFALPPLNEQRRIVAKIEELFSDLDAGVVALERVRANLKWYRAAVLKAAVEGKLTADWRAQHPDVEPSSVLLKRLQGEQQGILLPVSNGGIRSSRRSSRLAGSHSFDLRQLAETGLPSGWALARLDHICKEIVDCPHSTPRWTDKGVACVRTTEFRPGRLLLDPVRYVSETTYQERITRLKPEAEDILYSREGGILGIACIVPPGIRLCLGQRMMLMRATVTSRYLMHVLNSPQLLSLVAKLTGGSASPHLNVGDVKAFPIPFPPYAEQLAIVQEIKSRLSIVDEVEAQVEANLKRAARLRQGILKRAFEGRLVPQDPTDEPGSRLLKRVREGLESYAQGDIGTASKRPRQTRR